MHSYEWLYGQTPEFHFETNVVLDGQTFSLKVVVDKGLFKSISLISDQQHIKDMENGINLLLKGTRFESSSVYSMALDIPFDEKLTELALVVSRSLY
ncbi:hypothetical protein AYI68_g6376 [Smittium mucronatum]|uniref:lipoate--protein ligase n=1 Tax=Smittium mucronatum TaxID=133383 RepID=A0A1R0GRP0_9FUNG|nr:hypothetical protein AYI68_g6376 [Smittium mucronatum]